jgi:hypothetical protein
MQDRVTNNRTCSSDYLQNDDSGDDLLIDLELSQAQIDELNAILDSEDEEYEEGYVALPDMQDYDGEHSDEVDELLNVGAPSVREIAFVEMPQSLVYLAKRQHSDVAYTPVNGKAEVQLFKTLMLQLMSESRSVKSIQTFDHMRDEWNDIRKKYTEHLTSYFKKWSKNQARNEALKEAKASIILEGLEYTPVTHAGLETRTLENLAGRMIEQSEGVENASNSPDGTHHGVSFLATDETAQDSVLEEESSERPMEQPAEQPMEQPAQLTRIWYAAPSYHQVANPMMGLLAYQPSSNFGNPMMPGFRNSQRVPVAVAPVAYPEIRKSNQQKRQRRCLVPGCPSPLQCPGSSYRDNCVGRTGGDPRRRQKRTNRVCQNCLINKGTDPATCPGRWRNEDYRTRMPN